MFERNRASYTWEVTVDFTVWIIIKKLTDIYILIYSAYRKSTFSFLNQELTFWKRKRSRKKQIRMEGRWGKGRWEESSHFRYSPYRQHREREREDLSYVICDFIQPPYQMIVWEKKKPFWEERAAWKGSSPRQLTLPCRTSCMAPKVSRIIGGRGWLRHRRQWYGLNPHLEVPFPHLTPLLKCYFSMLWNVIALWWNRSLQLGR